MFAQLKICTLHFLNGMSFKRRAGGDALPMAVTIK